MSVRRWRDALVWWVSTQVFGNFRYRARRGLHRGLNVVGGLGFLPSGRLSDEEAYLDRLDLKGKTVYDVGAFVGLRTLYFASRAGRVISYEPNSRNRARLERNLAANPSLRNVTVRPVGAGSAMGSFTVLWNEQRPGECVAETSPVGRMLIEQGVPVRRETVPVVSLDDDVRQLPPPSLIKIDVEGLELEVLRGAARVLRDHRPDLFIELHGSTRDNKLANARAVLDLVFDHGYRVFDVEQHRPIERGAGFEHAPSHIHCTPAP
jgi:FkbM family methyltransferase